MLTQKTSHFLKGVPSMTSQRVDIHSKTNLSKMVLGNWG